MSDDLDPFRIRPYTELPKGVYNMRILQLTPQRNEGVFEIEGGPLDGVRFQAPIGTLADLTGAPRLEDPEPRTGSPWACSFCERVTPHSVALPSGGRVCANCFYKRRDARKP